MNMHDKDIDALFHSKLDDFEAEPSAGVYANINRELHGDKRHKSVAPLLRIAASVIIALSVGLIFWMKNEKPDQNQPQNKLVKNQPVKQALPVQQIVAKSAVDSVPRQFQKVQSKGQLAIAHRHIPVVQQALVKKVVQPTETAANQPVQLKQKDSVVTFIAANQLTAPAVPVSIKPAAIAPDLVIVPTSVLLVDEENTEPAKKPKIRGLGGLLNAVIASVDKRPDKIIEFTDTDEGDSITGINLGIIKIKKQN